MENTDDLASEVERLKKREFELLKDLESATAAGLAKSEFIANISHDLRTPLHAILSYSRFGMNKIDRVDKEKIIKYFIQIEKSGIKLQHMLDKLVDLSKLESGRMVFHTYTCKLSAIVQSLKIELSQPLQKKRLNLKVEIGDIDSVSCDQNKIALVMHTLLDNAIENAPEGSQITITVAACGNESIVATELKICFKDQRIDPLPQELISDIESYLHKEKIKLGSGDLGVNLAICNEIVKQHRGRLWAERAGDGSLFCFSLPCQE